MPQGHRVQLVPQDPKDLQVQQDLQEVKDQLVQQEQLVHKELLGLQVPLEQLVVRVLLV